MMDEKKVTVQELGILKASLSADLERLVHVFEANTGLMVDEVEVKRSPNTKNARGRSVPETLVAVKVRLP